MAMKCSRLTWSRLLTALGGAAIAVGIGSARLAPACEVGMYPTEDAWCEAHAGFAMAEDEWMHEHAPPAPIDDLDPAAEAGYFDNGPVEDEIAADQEESIGSWYRYEFPGDADETECGYEYGNYEYEDHCADDESETAEQVAETESAYDDEWDYEYGDYAYEYEDHYAADEPETAEQVEDVVESPSAYDDEWGYMYGKYDDAAEHVSEETAEADRVDSHFDDTWRYECDRYDYACPEEAYGYSPSFDVRESDEAIAPQSQGYQGYSEAYPDEEYAYPGFEEDEPFECFDDSASWDRQPEVSESGLELFAWHPTELLMASDQQVLRTLETQCEEPSGVRRASLNGYVEDLGWEAIDFASQFEDRTGIEVLGLADDLPGAAAFLGVFRLVERGELGMEEGIDLLRRSLQRLSLEWIEGVSEITADAFADPDRDEAPAADGSAGAPAGSPVVDAMLSLAVRSLAGLGGAVSSVSQSLCDLDWSELATTAIRSRSAMVNPPIQR